MTKALSLSVSLYRLTRGLVGPAGNVWVQRGPSPRKKVAPQSLPTSWETPMPLVSPPALSCRIHASSPSSESHTSWPVGGGLCFTVDDILSTENVVFVRCFTGLFNLLVFAATPDGVSLGICTGYLQFLCHNGLLFRYKVNISTAFV